MILKISDAKADSIALSGGKGASLARLSRLPAVSVPGGCIITTDFFKKYILPGVIAARKNADGPHAARESIKSAVTGMVLPADAAELLQAAYREMSGGAPDFPVAVRSSATAEDLPDASFAGQQDSYLNVRGFEAVKKAVMDCFASLYNERAIAYRAQNEIDENEVHMAVVVQEMADARAAGVLFTADPVTNDRLTTAIEAVPGFGDELVSGRKTPASYSVKNGSIERRSAESCVSDEEIFRLTAIGKAIEKEYGCPQDIEWVLARDGGVYIVQSRPITTLYPAPENTDGKNHIYWSFSHQQMMMDAIKPLGTLMFTSFSNADVFLIGGRLYGDMSADLGAPVARAITLKILGLADPLSQSAVKKLLGRKEFMKNLARKGKKYLRMGSGYFSWAFIRQIIRISRKNDDSFVPELIRTHEESAKRLDQKIRQLSGDAVFQFIIEYQKEIEKDIVCPGNMAAVYAGVLASLWLNKHIEKWLGEKNICDSLTQSVEHNITSQMGLDLLDVTDVVRKYPEMKEVLQNAKDKTFFEGLNDEAAGAFKQYLGKYGMRCVGEIDITRPRFHERPTALVPLVMNNLQGFEAGARQALFEKGLKAAQEKEKEIISKLSGRRAKKVQKKIRVLRNFTGYREYPKYMMICRYWIIKQALLREAEKLVQGGVLKCAEDAWYLNFAEFREAAAKNAADYDLIESRRAAHKRFEKLTPPRVMTSSGEAVSGEYEHKDLPEGALAGMPVSAGVVEGRARVVSTLEEAYFEDCDILVTAFTDPSWTPAFVMIRGLVTEVGGKMTHGAVVAREYGLPAVVGVENATRLIRDGQRIRVDGAEGYVEILP